MELASLLLVFYLNIVRSEDPKIIRIDGGLVKGYKSERGSFYEYLGIPYALMPKGAEKYKGPLPHPEWNGIFEATNGEIQCPQMKSKDEKFRAEIYEENCLVANVFVPDTQNTNLSVIVHIHGGGYRMGRGNFHRPSEILENGKVIIVTFNYRLHVLGFLCLGTKDVPGNAGLKDQLALLRWVNKNIKFFGGNPEDVTLSGCSAGAAAAELLMLSKTTDGLIHKVIIDSGSILSQWSMQLDPIYSAQKYAERFRDESFTDLEDYYKNTEMNKFFEHPFPEVELNFTFSPCVEKYFDGNEIITEAPIDILKKGDHKKIPMLISFVTMETFSSIDLFYETKEFIKSQHLSSLLPINFKLEKKHNIEKVTDAIKEKYFKEEANIADEAKNVMNYYSDYIYVHPMLETIKYFIQNGNDRVYLYRYGFFDPLIQPKSKFFPNIQKATHCSQLSQILDMEGTRSYNEADFLADKKKVKNQLIDLWTNFAMTSKPVTDTQSSLYPEGWPAVTSDKMAFMEIDKTTILKNDSELSNVYTFWSNVYAEGQLVVPVSP